MNRRRTHGSGDGGPSGRFFGPGELRLALLSLVDDQSGHGYALMTRLEERFDGAYRASAGAVYPTLQQLEDEGVIEMRPEGGRKVYHATADGRREVASRAREIERIWARAGRRGEWAPLRDPYAAEIVAPALRLMKAAVAVIVRAHGDPAVVDEVRAVFEDARHRVKRLGGSRHHH